MKIIISPAKKMVEEEEIMLPIRTPILKSKAEQLLEILKIYDVDDLGRLMKCNEKIANLNYERFQQMDLNLASTPALLAYEGIQYQYMATKVFTREQWEYAKKHLFILSGFYGVLGSLDGVVPYRLEMQTKLKTKEGKDLYEFWKDAIYSAFVKEEDCILNLASKEYSKIVKPYLSSKNKWIECTFGEKIESKIKVKGTLAKMARGEMVRFLSLNNIVNPVDIKEFAELGFSFSKKDSSNNHYVFLKEEGGQF